MTKCNHVFGFEIETHAILMADKSFYKGLKYPVFFNYCPLCGEVINKCQKMESKDE